MSKSVLFFKIGAATLLSFSPLIAASTAPYAPGEVIVTYKSLTQLKGLRGLDARLHRFATLSRLEGRSILAVHSSSLSTQELIRYFQNDPNVVDVHPNYIYHLNQTPNDTYFDQLWAMKNTGQEINGKSGTPGADINATKAWDVSTGSSDYVVAILDTGVDYLHDDLKENIWSNSAECNGNAGVDDDDNGYTDDCHGYDFAADNDGNNDSDPMPDDPVDDNGHYHGTHVAGTIGAKGNNNLGVTGVNWNVTLLPVKVFRPSGGGYESDILEGIDYVATLKNAGVNIVAINASYGGSGSDDTMKNAIKSLGDLGILFVAAAGNDGDNNDRNPQYPASYDLDNIVAVAATDQNDQLTSFSNYGRKTVDLAAPGENILSTYPRDDSNVSRYAYADGTSMATPHVTGSVALVWDALHTKISGESNASVQAQIIKRHILANVDHLADLNGKVLTGGRLDLGAAVINHVQLQQTYAQTRVNKSVTIKVAGDNGTDREGDALSVRNPSASHGSVVVNSGDESLTYTPDDGFTGSDTIRVDINDSLGDSATATVVVDVLENHPPQAVDDQARVQENGSVRIAVLANDRDEDGDTLTLVEISQAPKHGKAEIDGNYIVYTPEESYIGNDSLRYTVSDGEANASASVSIEVYASTDDGGGSGGGSAGGFLSILLSLAAFLLLGIRGTSLENRKH
ncbi:S8 family serine peptidase [Nitratifractor salsuginis]|uniref:Peptidase S8 and S53 subtilisin kexin sedolisin n=1 Tax=Nitratifractor salsuginis (strain DSM 16511 / JCM 12458 / E9I37-1) TaxID=749222 RepID=E6WZE7_NITSE|nr:S8 family serine peptidase [Nitratifractor salsuginis]ADV45527.1 peptidase S8 and S53 subtilisin kexin sedolisin [Nitratifractor salsuginis DSM 16511]